ncbi:MAG: YceD family protein [Sciscionella sp.]
MSESRTERAARSEPRHLPRGPWIIDTRDLARQPGASRHYHRTPKLDNELGLADVIRIPVGSEVDIDVLCESAGEGVWVSGTATTDAVGECARCLEPLTEQVRVEVSELFAYPDSITEATTDTDEVSRLMDDLIDLEPTVRDAIVLALPPAPLCTPDCQGLCVDCGRKWAELGPDHRHERMDPRWAALRERFGGSGENPA